MMAQTNGTRKKRPCAKVGDSVWIELIVVSVRYAAGKEPGRLAASRVVEGSVALVEDIEFSHDLQSAPAATAVKHRVINYRTAPPAPLLIGLVTAEEPASFDIPTGESWIGDADKGIRCARKASGGLLRTKAPRGRSTSSWPYSPCTANGPQSAAASRPQKVS